MNYRKLRIAWLSAWLAFAVLAAMRMQIQLGLRIMPHGLLALLFVAIAVAPWILYWVAPRQFSLRTLLIAITLVAVVLGIVVWPGFYSVKWVGSTNLKVRFVVTDASSGQPIPDATVHIRPDPGGFSKGDDANEFNLTTDENGHVDHLCANRTSFGSDSLVEDTFFVHLPGWQFHVTANGYSSSPSEYIDVPKNRRRVQRLEHSAIIEIPVALQRSAADAVR